MLHRENCQPSRETRRRIAAGS